MEKDQDTSEERRQKNDADSGNDSSNEMLQHENLIDPGNEHRHDADRPSDKGSENKHDADSGGDGTGSVGKKPQ
jgi:hypothetical protein